MKDSKTRVLIQDREAAEMLGCSRATIWRRVNDGTIPQPVRFGGLTRWPRDEIEAVIELVKAKRAKAKK